MGYPTRLPVEPRDALFCSHSYTWMGNPPISNLILNFMRSLAQQGNKIKVKKNSIFLLSLIFGQLAYQHHLSLPQFLTVIGTKVMTNHKNILKLNICIAIST